MELEGIFLGRCCSVYSGGDVTVTAHGDAGWWEPHNQSRKTRNRREKGGNLTKNLW